MNYFSKRNKYGAKRTVCSGGHRHPSQLECRECECLSLRKKAGDIKDFEYAKRYELRVNGVLVGHHKPDFTVTHNDGSTEIRETKGMVTPDFVLRKNVFEAIYPEMPYNIIR